MLSALFSKRTRNNMVMLKAYELKQDGYYWMFTKSDDEVCFEVVEIKNCDLFRCGTEINWSIDRNDKSGFLGYKFFGPITPPDDLLQTE